MPTERPAIAVETDGSGTATVYASWNGVTEFVRWRVLAGSVPSSLLEAATAERAGFETEITVQTDAAYIAVEDLDASSNILGASEAVETGA